jgi:hypothetical protein
LVFCAFSCFLLLALPIISDFLLYFSIPREAKGFQCAFLGSHHTFLPDLDSLLLHSYFSQPESYPTGIKEDERKVPWTYSLQ